MTAIDASKCMFVCWVDLDGGAHMTSESGYGQRQIGAVLRLLAERCDEEADRREEAPLDAAHTPRRAGSGS